MVRIIVPLVFLLLVGAACDTGSSSDSPTSDNGTTGPPVTAVARPESVPAEAEEVTEEQALGEIERQADSGPELTDIRLLQTAACQNDVMTLSTDQEDIYAALPCDRFWNDETVEAFSRQEVAIRLTVDATRFQIFIETVAGGQAEFTVGGIWLG
jgi:hypothetical protein